jgi:hypothetical protein
LRARAQKSLHRGGTPALNILQLAHIPEQACPRA